MQKMQPEFNIYNSKFTKNNAIGMKILNNYKPKAGFYYRVGE